MPKAKKKRLFLVDAMSQIYRAYYAIRGLSTSSGLPTNAIFGFTNILRRIINNEKPDYLAVAIDTPEPTFRHEAFEAYKATREKTPDDLNVQLPYIERVCEVLKVPVLRAPRFEADDIIGTLALKAAEEGLEVVIVTNDKDMTQLVSPDITLLRADRNGDLHVLDGKKVIEKFGVRPDQIVELMGLWGDTTDNIPGAPGVGEKGARMLIQKYGTVENAIAHADEIERKTYRESLKNNVDQILQSRDLARIDCGMPVELDLDAFKYEEPDRHAAYELFSEVEFRQMMKEFSDAAAAPASDGAESASHGLLYSRVDSDEELDRLVESLWSADSISLAVGARDSARAGVAFSSEPGRAAFVDFTAFKEDPLPRLKDLLENGLVRKSVHDWKAALTALNLHITRDKNDRHDGALVRFSPAIRIEGVEEDTMLAAYLLDPNRTAYRLVDLAREYLNREVPESIEGLADEQSRVAVASDLTFELASVFRDRIAEAGLEAVYREIELPLVEILFEMERTGILIDTAALEKAGRQMEKELTRLTREIYEQAGEEFNINSTVQLGEIFEKLNFEVGRKTRTGRISTSSDVLEELAAKYELPRLIIEYREIAKLKNTYVDALPRLIDPATGRIHTTLNQAVAATGRLSSTTPNLQNIPIRSELGRTIRAAFVASPGHVLMSADYSQIELRVFAHITGDPMMTEAFAKGEDIHASTARAVFGAKTKKEEADARRLAKIVNFAIAYAVGPFGLAQRTGLTRAQAKKVIDDYYETFKGVRRYMSEIPVEVRKTGVVRTLFGRLRPIPDINNRSHALRARAEREAINAPIQGTAADLMKMAMIKVHDRLERERLEARLIMQVHDELLLEIPDDEVDRARSAVVEEMESVHELSVPLVVDVGVGRNWMEAKP